MQLVRSQIYTCFESYLTPCMGALNNQSVGYIMSSQALNFLLNTENYEPLFNIVKQITEGIRENEKILARIAHVVDENVRYPLLPSVEIKDSKESAESSRSGEGSQEERDDSLRNILNQKFCANRVAEVHQFDDVENSELRQLLCDNYKLLQIKKAKGEKSRQLLGIVHEYESLFLHEVIPTLARDSSERNLENLRNIQREEVYQKLKAQENLWSAYGNYVSFVDKGVRLVENLMRVLESSLDSEETKRLATQLMILENFKSQLKEGSLHRTRWIDSIGK